MIKKSLIPLQIIVFIIFSGCEKEILVENRNYNPNTLVKLKWSNWKNDFEYEDATIQVFKDQKDNNIILDENIGEEGKVSFQISEYGKYSMKLFHVDWSRYYNNALSIFILNNTEVTFLETNFLVREISFDLKTTNHVVDKFKIDKMEYYLNSIQRPPENIEFELWYKYDYAYYKDDYIIYKTTVNTNSLPIITETSNVDLTFSQWWIDDGYFIKIKHPSFYEQYYQIDMIEKLRLDKSFTNKLVFKEYNGQDSLVIHGVWNYISTEN